VPPAAGYRPSLAILELGDGFYDVVAPAKFPGHVRRFRNQRWAAKVGLDSLDDGEWKRHFAAFESLPANLPERLALRYHGHQFRSYNPHLGDGRGFLHAQLFDVEDGRLLDLGTKGSGQTPYSRGGDGRLTLKGGVREVLATEMLEALGVYTSKSFSLFETGEALERGDEPSPTRSSVLVRLSHSHVRFGSFQRHAAARDAERINRLLAYTTTHLVPENGPSADGFLRAVVRRSARLAASWIVAGFVHGVLNTDNMNVTGESFDYGPYRFLPTFDPEFTAAYFDETGLYRFGRQPAIVGWNLERLAECLALVAPVEGLREALSCFESQFQEDVTAQLLSRLGLAPRNADDDGELLRAAFTFLHERTVGFDRFYFDWYGGDAARAMASPAAKGYAGESFEAFRRRLAGHEAIAPERLALPYYRQAGPCSLLIDEIETIWSAIDERDDWGPFEAQLAAIAELRSANPELVARGRQP
jgi:serine/tyrosine/threonine adenylyltransferase